ncbi:hypothetical protein BH24ACI5_BH24ACI5_13540 [soil metagenome]
MAGTARNWHADGSPEGLRYTQPGRAARLLKASGAERPP